MASWIWHRPSHGAWNEGPCRDTVHGHWAANEAEAAAPMPMGVWPRAPHQEASYGDGRMRLPSERPHPLDEGGAGMAAAQGREWSALLLRFANRHSVELQVLGAQPAGGALERMPCRPGDVVACMSYAALPGRSALESTAVTADCLWCIAYRGGDRREGAVARNRCSPCEHYEFVLKDVVPPGGTLGLRGSVRQQGLAIEAILPGGLVERWNAASAHTDMRNIVRVGDVIVKANGEEDPALMVSALLDAERIQLTIRRGLRGGGGVWAC